MGSVFSPPKKPDPPPLPPPPPEVPTEQTTKDQRVQARNAVRKRAIAAQSREDDIMTSPSGIMSRAPHRSSLLGR